MNKLNKIILSILVVISILLIIFLFQFYKGSNKNKIDKKNIVPSIEQLRSYEKSWTNDFEDGWNAKNTICSTGKINKEAKEWWFAHMQGEYAGEVITDPDKDDNKVMKFEWRENEGKDCNLNSQKKAHLYGYSGDISNSEFWSFDIYFPSDGMEKDSQPEIIAQWHGNSDDEEPREPPLALETKNDDLFVTWIYDSRSITPKGFENWERKKINIGNIQKDKWTRFELFIDWDPFGNGILIVWRDGVKLIDEKNIPIGFNDKESPYFGFGFYKYTLKSDYNKRIIYFDNINQSIIS